MELSLRGGRAQTVTLEPDEGHVVLKAGKRRIELPLAQLERATGRSVALAGGNRVGIVEAEGGGQRVASLLVAAGGGVRELWTGALDPRGDPGERHGYRIEVADRTGDGAEDVIVGAYHERTGLCGQRETLLSPRAVDPQRLQLVPVVLTRVASDPGAPQLQASLQSPGPTSRPLLASALRLTGASSQTGGEPPWLATPPGALTDGDLGSAWFEGRGGGGRGEFVTFRNDAAAQPIRALAFTLPTVGAPTGGAIAQPTSLLLLGDEGAQLRVQLDPNAPGGVRQWVTLAEPRAFRCLSVSIEQSSRAGARDYAGLAEVELYTGLDFGEGVDSIVQALGKRGSADMDPVAVLTALGSAAVGPLRKALPALPARGRRRAVRVLASLAKDDGPAREALADLVSDAEEAIGDAALQALLGEGQAGAAVLVPRIADVGARGDQVGLALARRAPDAARPAILEALAAEGGSDRPSLRHALALSCERGGTALDEVEAWASLEQTPPLALAAAAQALAGTPLASGGRALALRLVETRAASAQEFVERWRLVEASRSLGPSDALDAWLAELAKTEERWMLRAEALTSLVDRKSKLAKPSARLALDDEYPRVRVVAVDALAGEPTAFERLTKHVQRDRWAMVRAAAVLAVASDVRAEPVLRGGAGDRSAQVRAAALTAMTRAKLASAWPVVKARLEDDGELPEVMNAGIGFARALCVPEAGEPLLALLRRGLDPSAWAPDVEVALQALEALAALGGSEAATAIALAAGPAAPAGFRQAADQAKKQKPSCPRPAP